MKLSNIKLKSLYVLIDGVLIYTGAEWIRLIYNHADMVGHSDYSTLSLYIEEFMETDTKNCHFMTGIC